MYLDALLRAFSQKSLAIADRAPLLFYIVLAHGEENPNRPLTLKQSHFQHQCFVLHHLSLGKVVALPALELFLLNSSGTHSCKGGILVAAVPTCALFLSVDLLSSQRQFHCIRFLSKALLICLYFFLHQIQAHSIKLIDKQCSQ